MRHGIGVRETNTAAWSHEPVVRHYAEERTTPEALYASERAVLAPALRSCASVLDVGCAAGGFYPILQELKPGLRYLGVDVVPAMIEEARRRYPGVAFEVSDGASLPCLAKAFDLVLCTGVLLHTPNYRDVIAECYRVASRGCVFDLPRLVTAPYTFDPSASYMVLSGRFSAAGAVREPSSTVVPYVLANPQPLFEFLLKGLRPRPEALAAVGYYGQPAEAVVIPARPVCFCVVYLAKGDETTQRPRWLCDLPQGIVDSIHVPEAERMAGGRDALDRCIAGSSVVR